MEMSQYVDEIKLELTGGLLHLELPDSTIAKVVDKALREVNRYIDTTKIITVPYSSCIDLSGSHVSSVSRIFRAEGYLSGDSEGQNGSAVDPMWAQQWQILCGGGLGMYNLNDWVMTYAAWNTALQIRNTTSTDLAFKQDMDAKKLYINCAYDKPSLITIEYVPVYQDVNEIKSDYWTDVLLKLSVALTKVTLGRIRSRYKQSNALWSGDGDQILAEGNEELKDLREKLSANSQVIYPID